MKKYLEVKIDTDNDARTGNIIVARLTELGFDSFVEEEDHLLAYCIKGDQSLTFVLNQILELGYTDAKISEIEDQNWNAVWESSYELVSIDERVIVRAPFHKAQPDMEYDIIIEPKMSFGTAHHETTSLMLQQILGLDTKAKSVLDMGSGTAVLAILAWMKGAGPVVAIDNDEWAYNNALENVSLNNADILVELGDASSINKREFDIILANINRNILLEDIPAYCKALKPGGYLLMSGFYEHDLPVIKEKCAHEGLKYDSFMSRNKWVAAVFIKH